MRQRRHRRHGARHAHPGAGAFDGYHAERLAQPVTDHLTCRGDLLRCRRVGEQAALRQPHTPDVGREAGVHVTHPEDHFGRPAAEIDDDERPFGRVQFVDSPAERQFGFLGPGDHLGNRTRDHRSENLGGHCEEHITVRRIASRRGRNHAHRRHLKPAQQLGVIHQRRPGTGQRVRGELPGGVDSLTEPHDPHLTMDVCEPAVIVDVGYQ